MLPSIIPQRSNEQVRIPKVEELIKEIPNQIRKELARKALEEREKERLEQIKKEKTEKYDSLKQLLKQYE
jgi:DNA-binding transcriptional regulator GbsR (MarR family)